MDSPIHCEHLSDHIDHIVERTIVTGGVTTILSFKVSWIFSVNLRLVNSGQTPFVVFHSPASKNINKIHSPNKQVAALLHCAVSDLLTLTFHCLTFKAYNFCVAFVELTCF